MVILNIAGRIKKTYISEKLGLFIDNLPQENDNNWVEEIKKSLWIKYETSIFEENQYDSKVSAGFEQRILNSARKIFSDDKYKDGNNKKELVEKYIDYIASNMIYIDLDVDMGNIPNSENDFPCFDSGSCQGDYVEKVIDLFQFISCGMNNEFAPMVYCIYSYWGIEEYDDRVFSITRDIEKYQRPLERIGTIIDSYLDSEEKYYLLDYLCNALSNKDKEYGVYRFMKMYSLCSLFLEEEKEKELDYKLPIFLDESLTNKEKEEKAIHLRKIRNKIAHGDFTKMNNLLDEWGKKYMDEHFCYDYYEYSRKGWILGCIILELEEVVRKLIVMELTDRESVRRIKKIKCQEKPSSNANY